MVNINERRLVSWRRGFVTEKVDLVGLEYLWKAVLVAPDNIVYKPIELLKDVYTNLSPKLPQDQVCGIDTPTPKLGLSHAEFCMTAIIGNTLLKALYQHIAAKNRNIDV